jgi:hypothetical protein
MPPIPVFVNETPYQSQVHENDPIGYCGLECVKKAVGVQNHLL